MPLATQKRPWPFLSLSWQWLVTPKWALNTYSVVNRSCQKDYSIISYEWFCKLVRKSGDFSLQELMRLISSAPILKHQEQTQEERIQPIPVDLESCAILSPSSHQHLPSSLPQPPTPLSPSCLLVSSCSGVASSHPRRWRCQWPQCWQ